MSVELGGGRPDVDVVVVGGGVNGAGVARDATMRGLRVALFERNDFAFGASGNSSGMIHGGLRYLTYDPNVTKTSCQDSGAIQRIAPHLLFRIPFLMPLAKGPGHRVAVELFDAFFSAYDWFQPLKRGKRHARLSADELRALEPGVRGDFAAAMTFDEWGIDGARLTLANALDAEERGASIVNHATVEEILRDPASGAARGVRYRERETGRTGVVTARAVVNATGAWSPLTTPLGGLPATSARVRPGKGIHVMLDRRLTNYAVVAKAIDGRQIFLEPWQNMCILGTTDDDYYGDLDDCRATSAEVRYLVEGVASVMPAVREARIIGTWAGVRPTLYGYGKLEDHLSREHEVVDHAAHGAPGLYSMIGGKLASYRLFAEEMTDVLASSLGASGACATHSSPLPGGEAAADEAAVARDLGVDALAARRLVYRHGARVDRVVERVKRRRREASVVCACEPVLEAEVRHVVATEHATSVDDVARRTRLGLGSCGGMRCAMRCGQIVAEERGLAPREGVKQARRFLTRQAATRLVGLGPEQARQEALALAALGADAGREDDGAAS